MTDDLENRALKVFRSVKAITNGHFVLTSSLHAKTYINKDAVYMHPQRISWLCRLIAKEFYKDEIEVVVAPAVGGVILSQWVAYHLFKLTRRDVLAVYAEKENSGFVIKRGYEKAIFGKRVLIVEDILTTGGSVKKVVDLARANGGIVVGVAALCNRGGVTTDDISSPPKFFTLIDIEIKTWTEEKCPLCKEFVPINSDIGKGREYLAEKAREELSLQDR
ncbi:MAG: phosphoribosyltransferase family protein [Candidatus Pacebacteria bacterium]|nr:phosphoribosyltransferase family protein [Candidatus Paceibacterota bacterium]